MENKEFSVDLGGKKLTFTFSNWAQQANASVIARYGDTVVLTTAVMGDKDKDMPFFPLTVEYREKYYAAGFIGGGRFHKREGRPSDEATLKARLIDRTLRPLFNHGIRREVQIVNTILSYDETASPDIVALLASSAALFASDIPWAGPVGAVRVGRVEGNFSINPSEEDLKKGDLELLIAGTKDKVNMIEVGASEAEEKDLVEAMKYAQEFIGKTVEIQEKIRKEIGKEKAEVATNEASEDLKKEIREQAEGKLRQIIIEKETDKTDDAVGAVEDELEEHLKEKYAEEHPEYISAAKDYFEKLTDELVHEAAVKHNKRVDGRAFDEVRPLSAQVGVLPRTHGSAVFMRGLTHALSTVTLDTPGEEELHDDMEGESKKRFMHHYNFPPYSTGEAKPFRGTGRREVGHGALAEKALEPLVADKEKFPYVIRAVTEILSSNGSSSMASVCGSSIALMDAGVPIERHIAGIAMGLMAPQDGGPEDNAKILTDIQGPEDHYGDMDFKVAGTQKGVTAIQMDVKIEGVSINLLEKALEQAKKARVQIIEVLENTIDKPRERVSEHAPVIKFMQIDPDKIGLLIGGGGRTIKELMSETNTEVNVEDDGSVFISGKTNEDVEKAAELADNLTREIKVGEVFDAKVVKIADFGAFVELVPTQEALVHVSELSDEYVKDVKDVVKVGERIRVKVINIDDSGRIKASAKKAK